MQQNPDCKAENRESIKEMGTPAKEYPVKIISIIGQIEGHTELPPQSKSTKYEHIIPMLTDAEQDEKVKGILVLMNTVGGDVEAGLAIAELIRGMSTPSVSLVLGGGHSIGVPLAVSADFSYITKTATMTIHPIRTSGLVINTPQTFSYYEKMQERVTSFVSECSKIDEATFKRLMSNKEQLSDDTGTVLIGGQAVEHGLIDAVGGLADAISTLKKIYTDK